MTTIFNALNVLLENATDGNANSIRDLLKFNESHSPNFIDEVRFLPKFLQIHINVS